MTVQIDEVMSALELLRDCTSVSAQEQLQDTEVQVTLLDVPTLQLRTSAMDATAELLKDMLPGDSGGCIP